MTEIRVNKFDLGNYDEILKEKSFKLWFVTITVSKMEKETGEKYNSIFISTK